MKIVSFTECRKGTLRYFVDVRLKNHLVIRGVALHELNGKRWAHLPTKPQVDAEGNLRRDEGGKIQYAAVVQLEAQRDRELFSRGAWDALEAHVIVEGQRAGKAHTRAREQAAAARRRPPPPRGGGSRRQTDTKGHAHDTPVRSITG